MRPIAAIALGWIAIISVLFLWRPDNAWAFNGTAVFLVLLVVYYFAWARTNFAGPRAMREDDLVRREVALGEAHHGVGAAPAD